MLQVAVEAEPPHLQKLQPPPEGTVPLYDGPMATQQCRRAGRVSASEEQWSTQSSTSSILTSEEAKLNSPRLEVVARPSSMAVKSFSYAQALKTSYPKVETGGGVLGSQSITPSDSPGPSKLTLRSGTATPASSAPVLSPTPSVGSSRRLVSPQGGSGSGGRSQEGGEEEERTSGQVSAEPPPLEVGGGVADPASSAVSSRSEGEQDDERSVVSPADRATPNSTKDLPPTPPEAPPLSPPGKDTLLAPEDKAPVADSVSSDPRITPDQQVAPEGLPLSQGDVIKAPPGLTSQEVATPPHVRVQNFPDHQKLLNSQRLMPAGQRLYGMAPPQARMAPGGSLMPVPATVFSSLLPQQPVALPSQPQQPHPLPTQPQQPHPLPSQQQHVMEAQQGMLEQQAVRIPQDHPYQQPQSQHPHHAPTPLQATPASFSSTRPAGSVPSRALLGNQPAALNRQQLEAVIVNILLQDQQHALHKHLLQQQHQQHALQKHHSMMLQQQAKAQMQGSQHHQHVPPQPLIPQHGAPQHSVLQPGALQRANPQPIIPQHGAPQHSVPQPGHGTPLLGTPQHGTPQSMVIEERKLPLSSTTQLYQQQAGAGQLQQLPSPGSGTSKSETPYLLHNPHLNTSSVPVVPPGLALNVPTPQHSTAYTGVPQLRGSSYIFPPHQPPSHPPHLPLNPSPQDFSVPQGKEVSLEASSAPSTETVGDSVATVATPSDSSDDQDQTGSQKGSSLSITATPFVPAAGIPTNPQGQVPQALPQPHLAQLEPTPPQAPPQSHPPQPHPPAQSQGPSQAPPQPQGPAAQQEPLGKQDGIQSSYEVPHSSLIPSQHIQTQSSLLYSGMGGGRPPMVPPSAGMPPSNMISPQVMAGRPAYQVISPQAERPAPPQQQQHGIVGLQRQLSGGGAERRGQESGRSGSKEHLHYRLPVQHPQQTGEQVGVVPPGMGASSMDIHHGRQTLPHKGFPPYAHVGMAGGGVHGKDQYVSVGRPMTHQQQQEAVFKQPQVHHSGPKRPLLPTPLPAHTHQSWPPTGGRPPSVPPHKLYATPVQQRNVPFSARAGLLGGMNTAYPRNPI